MTKKNPRWRRWLSLWTALVTLLFASSAFAQVQRGPLPVLGLRAPDGEDEAAQVATASLRRSATRAGFSVPDNTPALEQLIARHSGDGGHCYGSSVTLADVFLVPQVYNARRAQLDLSSYPRLARVVQHLESLPAFAAARPEAQPDAE